MGRVGIPRLTRAVGLLLRRIANRELLSGIERGSDLIRSEDRTVYYWPDGGKVDVGTFTRLQERDLVTLTDYAIAEYGGPRLGMDNSWVGRLWRVQLTPRGRAALVVFEATTDAIGRRHA